MPKLPGAGRKPTKIDWKYVNAMLQAGCAGTTIAAGIGVHPDTLYRAVKDNFPQFADFASYAAYQRSQGLDMLRAKQHDVAMKGDKTMLVWLGKNYLDQKDKVEQKVDMSQNIKVNFGE